MKTQRGSVLLYILIAVAMFAALSFAVGRMLSDAGGAANTTDERARILAAEIIDYGRGLRQAVQEAQIAGCGDQDISFENPVMNGYEHAAPGARDACKIFSGAGGGMAYALPPVEWLDASFTPPPFEGWFFPESTCVTGMPSSEAAGCASDGLDNEDLVALLSYIKEPICRKINESLGVTSADDAVPVLNDCHADTAPFTGAFTQGFSITHAALNGQPTGCFLQSKNCSGASEFYVFYQVLKAR